MLQAVKNLIFVSEGQSTMETLMNNVSKDTAIPVNIIAMIIAFISQIVSGCVPAPTPAQVIAGGGLMGQILIYRAMRANGIRPGSEQGQKLLASLQSEAAKLSEADAATFLSISQS